MGKQRKPVIKNNVNRRNVLKNLKRMKKNNEILNKIKSEVQ